MCVDNGGALFFNHHSRLNLRLFCTPKTPTKDTLDVWPALPLIVESNFTLSSMDNVIAALGQCSRVCNVTLWNLAGWQLEQVLATMQVPFPELQHLQLRSFGKRPAIPDSFLFLGGSICPTTGTLRVVWHSISCVAKTAFVC